MKYIRTNSLKRLFSLKWRSLEEATSPNGSKGVENNEILKNVEAKELSPRPTWKCFSYEEISDATNAFSSENLVGKGGYAEVYRGVLKNGEEIAVKRLTKAVTDERKKKEFLNEIGTIGHVESFKFSTPIFCRSFLSLLLNIAQVHHSSSARSVVQILNSNLLQLNLERLQVLNNSSITTTVFISFPPGTIDLSALTIFFIFWRFLSLLQQLLQPMPEDFSSAVATNARRLFKSNAYGPDFCECFVNNGTPAKCNICFELAQDPIITLCGHLFCWPCLYRWLHHHSNSQECPVCKALLQDEKLVPLYGRGKTQTDPRSKSYPGINIPNRPSAQRPQTAPPDTNQFANYGFGFMGGFVPMATAKIGNFTLATAFGGLIPSLLNIQYHGFPDATVYGTTSGFPYASFSSFHGGHAHGFPQPENHQGQPGDVLKYLFLLLGVFVIVAVIFGS